MAVNDHGADPAKATTYLKKFMAMPDILQGAYQALYRRANKGANNNDLLSEARESDGTIPAVYLALVTTGTSFQVHTLHFTCYNTHFTFRVIYTIIVIIYILCLCEYGKYVPACMNHIL